ncbi:PQQ-dependent sugar dehydrogenase [Kordiimonas pumila]|uniref:PQQ-dependent sugar dehydrogenase n=1 Tax=Kordiimonas pumila TaxID=2161677 RepID=A0ABV7D656_9PROT|nr:PQQ-dependent sugar dehydrogenase [Kordiimonas pumila]
MVKSFVVSVVAVLCLAVSVGAADLGVDTKSVADPITGIRLPKGFTSTVYADDVGEVRHIVMAENGWMYGALRRPNNKMGAVALRDADGDGIAEERIYFAERIRGSGIGIYDGYLYFATDVSVIRWKLPESDIPKTDPELVAHGFGAKRQHASKPMAFDGKGGLYVTVGAPSNACMERARTKDSPGMDPCPILDEFAGVWKFDANALMQEQTKTATRYVTGVRNAMAIAWNPFADSLYLLQHGRDQLAEFFPDFYTPDESADLPAEEFHKVAEGADVGWPYSYFDQHVGKRMVMPEYGGDGKTVSDKGQDPLIGFPGHWAPNALLFKQKKEGMPTAYQKGAFIAFHGSWNRTPMPQEGYHVVFVPMDDKGEPTGNWVVFADSFAGGSAIENPRDAAYRPTGLAEGNNGELYVSSSVGGGRIWRITYTGN